LDYESEDSQVQHCYLQSSIFAEGEGYWGTGGKIGAWPHWRSGTPGRRLTGFSPNVVVPGEAFDLQVMGVGLPFDRSARYNTAPRQRVKIMEVSQQCHEKPPEEVSGIGCTETTRKIQTAYGTEEETVYTICSPRPIDSSAEHVVYGDIMITSSAEDKSYKVCYCASQCYEPSSYTEIPGTIQMARSTFLWSVFPDTVYRKENEGISQLHLTVARPTFGSFSNPDDWELKVVRDYFGCGVLSDQDKFGCSPESTAAANEHDTTAPSVNWEASVPTPDSEGNATVGIFDTFLLTFDEHVTKEGCQGQYALVKSDGSALADVSTASCSSAQVQGSEVYIRFGGDLSSNVGEKFKIMWSKGAVSDMNGNMVEAGDSSGYGWTISDTVFGPISVLMTDPGNNGQGAGTNSTTTLYMSQSNLVGAGNITVTDCGDNGVCGDHDDSELDIDTTVGSSSVFFTSGRTVLPGHRFQVTVPENAVVSGVSSGPFHEYVFSYASGCPFPTYLDNPDVATWVFDMDLDVTDAGSYAVCFREQGGQTFAPIPSETDKLLTIHKLEEDRTHPRGIFHNQYFSALAGSVRALNVSVAGTRVPVPTDSKIIINRHGVCGDHSQFSGVSVRKPATDDTEPPVPLIDQFFPPSGSGISRSQALHLPFNEAVTTAGCVGNFTFVPTGDGNRYSYDCSKATATATGISFMPADLQLGDGATYYLSVDTGAVLDLAGNPMPILFTLDTYTVTTGSDDTAPQVIDTFPCHSCEGSLVFQDQQQDGYTAEDFVVVYFSEPVSAVSGSTDQITLIDCGPNFVCDADDDIVNIMDITGSYVTFSPPTGTADTSNVFAGEDHSVNRMYVYVGAIPDYRRYKMIIPAGSVTDTSAPGPSSDYSFEFVKNSANFKHRMAVSASVADSTEDSLSYALSLFHNMDTSQEYTVCYCNDQNDETLQDLGNGDTTYKLFDDLRCNEHYGLAKSINETLADRPVADHQCETKCSKGCTGPYCFCDGYDASAVEDTLCLPPSLCREACDMTDNCAGINVHDSKSQCTLLMAGACTSAAGNGTASESNGTIAVSEDWQLFTKKAGTACTHLDDFAERAGTLYVTSRVEVAVDYVLHPGQSGSIEITSPVVRRDGMDHSGYYYYFNYDEDSCSCAGGDGFGNECTPYFAGEEIVYEWCYMQGECAKDLIFPDTYYYAISGVMKEYSSEPCHGPNPLVGCGTSCEVLFFQYGDEVCGMKYTDSCPGELPAAWAMRPDTTIGDMCADQCKPPDSLTFEHSPVYGFTARSLLSRDRITIIDCKGTCGVSSPTSAIVEPADGDKIETWNDLSAHSWFVDLPSLDSQNQQDPATEMEFNTASGARTYTARENSYCPMNNIDLDAHEIPFGGVLRPLKEHQCYQKCGLNAPCDGDDCHCDGYYSGYDSESSNALCADTQLCQYLCDNTQGCTSIDMHTDVRRCFLNSASDCETHEDSLAKDPNYVLLIRDNDPNDEQAGAPGTARRLLPATDFGFSWDRMLRFHPVQFKSGGTFKLCFCDSEILGPGGVCSSERDYKIEVGTIHASGVSCLIAKPKLQRVSCTEQHWGGLRCYEHTEAPRPQPPTIGMTVLPSDKIVTSLTLSAKCLYMPEEEASQDENCQVVSAHQSSLR